MADEEVLSAHESDLRRVLEVLVSQTLNGSGDKATIALNGVEFAGNVVGTGQHKLIPGHIAAVENWEAPRESPGCERSSYSAITILVMLECMQNWSPRRQPC